VAEGVDAINPTKISCMTMCPAFEVVTETDLPIDLLRRSIVKLSFDFDPARNSLKFFHFIFAGEDFLKLLKNPDMTGSEFSVTATRKKLSSFSFTMPGKTFTND